MMRSTTKTRLLLVAFTLIFLGWAQPGWSVEMAADMREFSDKLRQEFESAYAGPYGAFVRENISVIAGVYCLFALFLLSDAKYRNKGWNNLMRGCITLLVFVVWFIVGYWIAMTCQEINQAHGGHWAFQRGLGSLLISIATGIIWPLLMIALGLTFWIGIPLYLLFLLLTLPSVLFVILRLLVRLPLLTYHYLHYLTVPHPAETAYRAGMAGHLPIPELARTVADAMYRYDLKDFEALPKAWKSKNWTKRIDAFHDRLQAEDRFMEELIKNLRLRSQLYE
jgi:hypothetical protein